MLNKLNGSNEYRLSLVVEHAENGPTNKKYNFECEWADNVVVLHTTCVGDFNVANKRYKAAMTQTTE
mgnify:CR=1 FL=1